jgi:hypothetical protein
MKEPINGQYHTIEDLNATRRKLQEKAGNFNDENTRAAVTIALRGIDNYLRSIPQGDMLMGNVSPPNAALTEARSGRAKSPSRAQGKLDTRARFAGPGNNRKNVKNGR